MNAHAAKKPLHPLGTVGLIVMITAIIAMAYGYCSVAAAQNVDVYISSKAGDRLTKKSSLRFKESGTGRTDFVVDTRIQKQTIIGFGASFVEAGATVLNSLAPAKREALLRSLFDANTGAGFSAMKTVIAATDAMSAGPYYSYDDVPGDVELKHFTIHRDLEPNGLINYIKSAQRYGKFVLQATMDYPPDWMLQTNQDVDSKYYEALARYYVLYLKAYAREGITIDHLSPFNEPTGYTKISYAEIRDFIKNYLGPTLVKSGLKIELQISDSPYGRSFALANLPIILEDPEARKYIATLSYHGYDSFFTHRAAELSQPSAIGGNGSNVEIGRRMSPSTRDNYDFSEFKGIAELRSRYPDLPLWMTEICYYDMSADGHGWMRPLPKYDFEDGDFWGKQIAADLEAGASGWTYWNMILDQDGGPALVSPEHGYHPQNVQHPVVIIDRRTEAITYTGLYYYLAHFSRFVRPGAHRVEVSGYKDDIKALGFELPGGGIVLEVINSGARSTTTRVGWNKRMLVLHLPGTSISTYLWNTAAR
jgi:glucosylceramidase